MDLTFTESDLRLRHNALLLKYKREKQVNQNTQFVVTMLKDKLKENDVQILELKEKVVRLETDQVYKIEDLLKK